MFAGHTKVLGGPYVARGPDVAQAFYIQYYNYNNKSLTMGERVPETV